VIVQDQDGNQDIGLVELGNYLITNSTVNKHSMVDGLPPP